MCVYLNFSFSDKHKKMRIALVIGSCGITKIYKYVIKIAKSAYLQ